MLKFCLQRLGSDRRASAATGACYIVTRPRGGRQVDPIGVRPPQVPKLGLIRHTASIASRTLRHLHQIGLCLGSRSGTDDNGKNDRRLEK